MYTSKVVWITGASSGIGRSIAVTLSSLGANCILLARNKERLEETQRMCVNPSEVFPIDLANFNTCSFIATDDLGKTYEDGTFEILGRLDASDIRGCNLLVL